MRTQTASTGNQSTLSKYFGAAISGIFGPGYDPVQMLSPIEIAMRGVEPKPRDIGEVIARMGPDIFRPVDHHVRYLSKTKQPMCSMGNPYMTLD